MRDLTLELPATGAAAGAHDDPMTPRRHRVLEVRRETADVVTLALAPVAGEEPEAPFRPGQFNMVYAFGVGEVPLSMSSDPASPVVHHTIREVGLVTRALCGLGAGAMVGIRGPFGRGWDLESLGGRDLVLVAGGIGLAPLKPAIHRILAERDRYGRVLLLVGARTPADIPFAAQLDTWRAGGIAVETIVDYAQPGWGGSVGVVTQLIPRAPFTPVRATALVCGPEVMMRLTAKALVNRGVAPEQVRVSLERNMKCAVARCGHCQLGPAFVCADGPVLPWPTVAPLLEVAER
jgi:NAD(P)H-flavin reductase